MATRTDPAGNIIHINRAPVMTLWASVVAERLGYGRDEALSLGKAVAVLNAQAKGKRLGIFDPQPPQGTTPKGGGRDVFSITLTGRPVPVAKTPAGLRAVVAGETFDPAPIARYLERSFRDRLDDARNAMRALAAAFTPTELAAASSRLYERFRPAIPEGVRGWGARGELNLDLVRKLRPRPRPTATRTKAAPPAKPGTASDWPGERRADHGRAGRPSVSPPRGVTRPREARSRARGSSRAGSTAGTRTPP